MIAYMRSAVEDHLAQFVRLYGNHGAVRLRPKHHVLVHLPSIILKCGPQTAGTFVTGSLGHNSAATVEDPDVRLRKVLGHIRGELRS